MEASETMRISAGPTDVFAVTDPTTEYSHHHFRNLEA